jgi:hypothetical protein
MNIKKYYFPILTAFFFTINISNSHFSKAQSFDETCTVNQFIPIATLIALDVQAFSGTTCSSQPYVTARILNVPILPNGTFVGDLLSFQLVSNDAPYSATIFYDNLGGTSIPPITPFITPTFSNLPAGNYTLFITYTRFLPGGGSSISHCNKSFPIAKPCPGIGLSCGASTSENCIPQNDGSINVNISGGEGPFHYTWSNGTSGTDGATASVFNIPHGTYSVVVTDDWGHQSSISCGIGLNNNTVVSMTDLNLPAYVCLSNPPLNLMGETPPPPPRGLLHEAAGTFSGPGVVNNIFTAKDAGAGTKTLTYSLTFNAPYEACNNSGTAKVLVLPKPPYINRVISATAMPYSDNWPVDLTQAPTTSNLTNLLSNDFFNKGSKGIWRDEESYVYVEDRKQRIPTISNPNTDIKLDGIYDTLPLYLFNVGDMSGCFPGWRKTNTVTRYNPYSYEIENKDVLGRYSSALYGYRGDLSVGVGANAAENEIAYDGFEEYDVAHQPAGLVEINNGNLTVFKTNSSNVLGELYREYDVTLASDASLTLNATPTQIAALAGKSVNVFGAGMDTYDQKIIYGTYAIASVNPAKNSITLTSFPYTAVWKGKISFIETYTPIFSVPNSQVIVSTTSATPGYAHTGKSSMLIAGAVKSELYKMSLIPGKSYVLSSWLKSLNSLNENDTTSYQSPSGSYTRGISLEFYDNSGNPITGTPASSVIVPSGAIIEGWQRAEDYVTIPANTARVVLVINSGLNTTLWDDIRIYPLTGNMQTYVYNKENYKVSAVLDNNNYATFYYYDSQGNLFLLKKETEKGIQTIQESFSHQRER